MSSVRESVTDSRINGSGSGSGSGGGSGSNSGIGSATRSSIATVQSTPANPHAVNAINATNSLPSKIDPTGTWRTSSSISSLDSDDSDLDEDDGRSGGNSCGSTGSACSQRHSIEDVLWELVKRGYELKELNAEELNKAEKKAGPQLRKSLEEWGMKMEAADPRARKERIQEQAAQANMETSSRPLSKSADNLATVYSCKCGQVSFQPKRRLIAHVKKHINSSMKPSIDWFLKVREIELQVSKERIRKEQEALEQKQILLRGTSSELSMSSPPPSTNSISNQQVSGSSSTSAAAVRSEAVSSSPAAYISNSFTSLHPSHHSILTSPTSNNYHPAASSAPVGCFNSASTATASVDIGPIVSNPELEFLSEEGRKLFKMDVMEMSPKVLIQIQMELGQMAKRLYLMNQEKQEIKSELDKFHRVFKSQPPTQVQLQQHRQERAIRDAVETMAKAQALLNECTSKIERTHPQILASGAGIKRDSTALQSFNPSPPAQYHTPGSTVPSSVSSPVENGEPPQKKTKTGAPDAAATVLMTSAEILKADEARWNAQVRAGNEQATDILAYFATNPSVVSSSGKVD